MKNNVIEWCMDPNWGIAKDLIYLDYPSLPDIYVVPFHFQYHTSDPYWWNTIKSDETAQVLKSKIAEGRTIVVDATMEGSRENEQITEYIKWLSDRDIEVKWAFNNARLDPIIERVGNLKLKGKSYSIEQRDDRVFFPHFLVSTLQEFEPYVKQDYSHVKKEYEFLCLNRRMRTGKFLLLKELKHRGLIDQTLYTYVKTLGTARVDNRVKKQQLQDDELKGESICADDNNYLYGLNSDIYHKVKVDIVNETYYFKEDQLHFTEKVFKPIMLGVPFVVNGVRGYLSGLKQLGFETFDTVIDESYDQYPNGVRYIKVVDAAIQLAKIYDSVEVRNICEYNKEIYTKLNLRRIVKNGFLRR